MLYKRVAAFHCLERRAGAPARERQQKARKLYAYLLKQPWKSRRFRGQDLVQITLRVEKVLPEFPDHTYLVIQFRTKLDRPSQGYYEIGQNKIHIKVTPEQLADPSTPRDPSVASRLVHEITHFLDEKEGALHFRGDPGSRQEYMSTDYEISAMISQTVSTVHRALIMAIEEQLKFARAGRGSLNDILFYAPEVLAIDSFSLDGIFEGRAPLNANMSQSDTKLFKSMGKHLDRKQKQRVLKKLYQSLEEMRVRELLPHLKNVLTREPHLLDAEDDEDYSYITVGPGARGAKAWWAWLLKQAR